MHLLDPGIELCSKIVNGYLANDSLMNLDKALLFYDECGEFFQEHDTYLYYIMRLGESVRKH